MARRPVLRAGDGRVGIAELFFDLVFVFAITQVSHYLLYHFTVLGAVQTALMAFLARAVAMESMATAFCGLRLKKKRT